MSIQSTNTLGEYLAATAALVLVAATCARPRGSGMLDQAGRRYNTSGVMSLLTT